MHQIANVRRGCTCLLYTSYVADVESSVFKAPKELKGFEKVFLKAGEEKTVEIHLDERAFSYYDTQAKAWRVESGKYQILVGSSSRDIRLTGSAQVLGTPAPKGEPEAKSCLLYTSRCV